MKIPFIKYSKVWYTVSILTTMVALYALFSWGIKLGIDFTGGSLVELSFAKNRPTVEQMDGTLKELKLDVNVIQKSGDDEFIIRTKFLAEDTHQSLIKKVQQPLTKKMVTQLRKKVCRPLALR